MTDSRFYSDRTAILDTVNLEISIAAGRAGRASLDEVLAGLTMPGKQLPCKLFYDERGSQLFDRICELEEYYPTRTETALMEANAAEIAGLLGSGVMLVEYGSGSSTKTRVLLSHLDRPAGYVPIDISAEHLLKTALKLKHDYPGLPIHPLAADFTAHFKLPRSAAAGTGRKVVYFPGSTIGNFEKAEAVDVLRGMARIAGPGGRVLIGVDLDKDAEVLHRAYDDSEGVTAEFNLNILARLNREFGSNFDLSRFEHRATYNPVESRVEIRLVSTIPQIATICEQQITFEAGEAILTEYSHKYTIDSFRQLAALAGLRGVRAWTDDGALFSVHLLEAA